MVGHQTSIIIMELHHWLMPALIDKKKKASHASSSSLCVKFSSDADFPCDKLSHTFRDICIFYFKSLTYFQRKYAYVL